MQSLDLSRNQLPVERMLGLVWQAKNDKFTFTTTVENMPITKRGILSTACMLFDPLGFAVPFVLPINRLFKTWPRSKKNRTPSYHMQQSANSRDGRKMCNFLRTSKCLGVSCQLV